MFAHIFKGRKMLLSSFFALPLFSGDKCHDSPTAKEMYAEAEKIQETGKTRLYYMFSTDEFGKLSPELNSVLQVGFFGSFFGAMVGGVNHSKVAYLNFIENNQATAFKDHIEAKKRLQDAVTVNFGKGAFRYGWRLGAFCTTYMLISTSVAVYRGQSSVLEYMIGGAVTGTMYKFTLGPRGMLVGGLLGSLTSLTTQAGLRSAILAGTLHYSRASIFVIAIKEKI